MNLACIQIVIELRHDLLGHFTVPEWNSFVSELLSRGLMPPVLTPGQKLDHPITVMIDLRGLRRSRYNLDGIDLRLCWAEGASFENSSLRHMRAPCARNASYRGARLDHSDFSGGVEISGCDFTGATGLDTTHFDGAVYDPANPPVGLPSEILACCQPEAEPPPLDRRQPTNPQEPTGFRQAPLKCHASIHVIPMETNYGQD